MSKAIAQHVSAFVAANQKAYAGAAKVFKRIEERDHALDLAALGITGSDIRVYATIYVATETGVTPNPSQRGGALTFKKDTVEYNRVKYIVDVATGRRAVYVNASKQRGKASASVDAIAKLVADYGKLTTAQKRKFLKLIGE